MPHFLTDANSKTYLGHFEKQLRNKAKLFEFSVEKLKRDFVY